MEAFKISKYPVCFLNIDFGKTKIQKTKISR